MVKLQYEMHGICKKYLDEIIDWSWAAKGAKLAILGAPIGTHKKREVSIVYARLTCGNRSSRRANILRFCIIVQVA